MMKEAITIKFTVTLIITLSLLSCYCPHSKFIGDFKKAVDIRQQNTEFFGYRSLESFLKSEEMIICPNNMHYDKDNFSEYGEFSNSIILKEKIKDAYLLQKVDTDNDGLVNYILLWEAVHDLMSNRVCLQLVEKKGNIITN
jgi:hypothetical protein